MPYIENNVVLTDLLSIKSIYPVVPKLIFFSTIPMGFIIAEIPLFADLIIYLPLSTDLKILCAKCCLGPMEFPNQPSSEMFYYVIKIFIVR